MRRALIVASVASMIDQFNMENIKTLIKLGYKVDVACNFQQGSSISQERILKLKEKLKEKGVNAYHIPIPRKLHSIKEIIKSYKDIKKLILEKRYELIHCHSPIGGAISRLAANKYRKKMGVKVIYTAHGFHFFSGAPFLNWLLYYPIEKILAFQSDVIITINKEDYRRAKKFNTSRIEYIPGVGIDNNEIKNISIDKSLKLKELGIPKDAYIVLSVGELNSNKNHETIIKSIARLNKDNVHYIICGKGHLFNYLNDLSEKLDINSRVHLLGYREDVKEILQIADLFAFPSYREGLGLAAIEAMAAGLPLITSNIHGINDYSIHGQTSLSCNPDDTACFSQSINKFINNNEFSKRTGDRNVIVAQQFDVKLVNRRMTTIYSSLQEY